jgi:hypothetical protein
MSFPIKIEFASIFGGWGERIANFPKNEFDKYQKYKTIYYNHVAQVCDDIFTSALNRGSPETLVPLLK